VIIEDCKFHKASAAIMVFRAVLYVEFCQ